MPGCQRRDHGRGLGPLHLAVRRRPHRPGGRHVHVRGPRRRRRHQHRGGSDERLRPRHDRTSGAIRHHGDGYAGQQHQPELLLHRGSAVDRALPTGARRDGDRCRHDLHLAVLGRPVRRGGRDVHPPGLRQRPSRQRRRDRNVGLRPGPGCPGHAEHRLGPRLTRQGHDADVDVQRRSGSGVRVPGRRADQHERVHPVHLAVHPDAQPGRRGLHRARHGDRPRRQHRRRRDLDVHARHDGTRRAVPVRARQPEHRPDADRGHRGRVGGHHRVPGRRAPRRRHLRRLLGALHPGAVAR